MIDSHCHLTDPRLFDQLDDVLARAGAAGVHRMISIGTNLADDRAVIALCATRPNLRCAIGIHPNYCHEARIEDVATLRDLLSNPAVLAIGETGLDYHHAFAERTVQRSFFEAQLALAAEMRRAVVIHSRESIDDTLAILKSVPSVRAVFHCFTGTSAQAMRVIDAGYLLGFTGAVKFKKADDLRLAARNTPRDRLLVETDSPYLSPEPLRSLRINEPERVMVIAQTIAAEWKIDVAEVDAITTANAERFFGWPGNYEL